jgi:hypothetical protein
MRLTSGQVAGIKGVARAVLGPDARVTLFGSQVDDALRGGDIGRSRPTRGSIARPT